MSSLIEKVFKDSDLQSEFLRAKITANPFDYKVSNRVFFVSNNIDFRKYDIYSKTSNTELCLLDLLKLSTAAEYLGPNPKLHCCSLTEDNINEFCGMTRDENVYINHGTLVMYNNLIVRDDQIANLKSPLDYSKNLFMLRSEKTLEGLETWFIKSTINGSLIPNLFYLVTEYSDKSLNDIENLTFTEELINKSYSPLIYTQDDMSNGETSFQIVLSCYNIPAKHYGYDLKFGFAKSNYYNNMQKTSVGLTIAYLMELLYQFKDIADKYPTIVEYLYYESSEFLKNFYTISADTLEINPDLEACFNKDNEIRFSNFKNYFDKILAKEESKFLSNDFYSNYFEMPVILEQMVSSAHAYAYQQFRLKHLTLFYTMCKKKGININSEMSNDIDGDDFGLPGMPAGGSMDESPSNELLDLGMDSYSKDVSNDDDANTLSEPAKKIKADPVLDAADTLKRDLHNSPYSFDVNYIKSSADQQEGYNAVANNIRMLTVNLSKQIKEIKVYNSGGKCGGQSSGKLDKKNLWKYRTDHNIFYNNNYKMKEMDLAFGIVLDESGSMSGEGIKNGKVVMILLHEVLNSLGINHSIVGHTSRGEHQCIIHKYYQFKEESHFTLQKPYALSKITSHSGNCDSGALYYMQSTMKSVQNKDKIVIIFSDGEPTECTDTELKEQVRDMEKSGIHVIGVGIDFDSIKEYYPDNANGKNLKEMIDIVVSILKRYVLEKKD